MTFSVPSALAAAISAVRPPPPAAVVSFDQLTEVPPLELDDELDEHPAVSSAMAVNPANAYRYGDLTSASLKASPSRSGSRPPGASGRRRGGQATPLAPTESAGKRV